MNAIAKASTFVLVLVASLPVLAVTTLSGCDKFKKGDADAAAEAGPVATTVDTSATVVDAGTPATTAIATTTWKPAVKTDGGVKLDAGPPPKLADGGVAPIPTPVPNGTLVPPPGFPTALPTTIPTTLPSGLVIPTALPTGAPKPSH